MGVEQFWVFFILLGLFLQAQVIKSQNLSCISNDLSALKGFSMSLNSGSPDGWKSDSSYCCDWIGVDCDFSEGLERRVVGLHLGNSALKGVVSKSLASLDQLRVLNLSSNTLHGVMPPELFHLQHLEVLDLSRNEFSGSIPAIIDLPSIRIFNISGNQFIGKQPLLVGSANLTTYIISDNLFSGSPDTGICNTSFQIQVLDFSSNRFSGKIPLGLENCRLLEELYLSSNIFSGNLPDFLFGLSSLRRLHLQYNNFSGQLNQKVGLATNVTDLDISDNNFSGSIPEIFGSLRNLKRFSAGSNNFTGLLPDSLALCSTLRHLDLRNNLLKGTININCTQLPHLNIIDLSSNQFSGHIPDNLSFCTELKILRLDRNHLQGQIPEHFKHLTAISYLSLSGNRLHNISATLGALQNLSNLTALVLAMNFQGEELPMTGIQGLKKLTIFVIPNSGLTGQIPPWLSNCTNLQVLDLSRNLFTGAIPPWGNEFRKLTYLNLSHNSLSGEIPINLTQLPMFELNLNPRTLCNQRTEELAYYQFQNLPPALDLSNNKLVGPIWPEFGNLMQLHILDLSFNNLSGTIPSNLSNMKNLEILDLSNNDLSGTIPTSLNALSFLSFFSVANNHLHGVIPTVGQFATFPNSSFEGNLGLCGALFVRCIPSAPGSSNEEDDENGISIVGLPMGIGAATGFILTVLICFMSQRQFQRGPKRKFSIQKMSSSKSLWTPQQTLWVLPSQPLAMKKFHNISDGLSQCNGVIQSATSD